MRAKLLVAALAFAALPLAASAGSARRGEAPPELKGGTLKSGEKRVENPVDPEPAPKLKATIAKLIKDLSAEDLKVRKAAQEELVEIGRPALAQLRAAAKSKDMEVAEAARKVIAGIEGNKGRSTVKIKTSGSREKGTYEISLVSSMETITVRDWKVAFGLIIKPADGKLKLYSEPTREEFRKRHPELWKKYAEPLLDEKHPQRAIKEGMVRELLPQFVREFKKGFKRDPKPKEMVLLEKLVRKKLDELFKKNKPRVVVEKPAPKKETPKRPKSPRRENPGNGPQLEPLK